MGESENVPPAATTVAVIDIGSNSIRMDIAEVADGGGVTVLERLRRGVHLGQDTFARGRLTSRTMNAAISILEDFRRVLDGYRVERVRAVATSAVREAANADAFLDRVYMACDLEVEVISTSEESRLKVAAVREALKAAASIDARNALVVEIGGGTALLTVLRGGRIVTSESCRLGSIRLQEALAVRDESPGRAADLIRHEITGMLSAVTASLPMKNLETFFAVGGDARFISAQIGRPTDSPDLLTFKLKRFDKLVARCEGLRVEQITRAYGLSRAEAETLVPALLVYQALIHQAGAKQLVASHTSMRDGLLLDLARGVTGEEDEQLIEGVVASARALAERYHCDMAHAECVSGLSVRLFDALAGIHRLALRDRLLLRVAGLLHEVGGFVSGRAHHKHSHYLISNSELFGLNGEEIATVALIARYHRRATPKQTHMEYVALPRERRARVSKLAAILRVADALDRGHAQQVRDIRIDCTPGELIIHVPGAADLTLERRAMKRKGDLFEDIFGRVVRLEEAAPAGDRTD